MALDSVPWFIDGGAKHSAAVARMLAYAATNGATGVNAPGDMKVTALPTPGAAVRIMPGGASMENRYPGGGQQSYTARNASATDVAVSATGSSGASVRYLIIRVDDPEFGGATPADVLNGPYVRPVLVSSITNLAYPFVALARINQPANTATITQAMITDLRQVANPRQVQYVEMGVPVAGAKMDTSVGDQYPSYRPSIEVPSWAVEVSLVATITAISAAGGDTYGEMAATLGAKGANQFRSANTFYDVDAGASAEQRVTFTIGAKGTVPPELRGTSQPLGTEFRRIDGPGYLLTNRGTNVLYQVTFSEAAV